MRDGQKSIEIHPVRGGLTGTGADTALSANPAVNPGAEPLVNTDARSSANTGAKPGRIFKRSLAIRLVTAGSTNACEQELVALGNSYYDVERFGIRFVASPRHADMLMVTGPVTRNMRQALVRTFEAMPEPKLVVAVGDDAIDGGIFKGSYGVLDGVANVIPVDYQIPGDPPSPQAIISHLLAILDDLDGKSAKKKSATRS